MAYRAERAAHGSLAGCQETVKNFDRHESSIGGGRSAVNFFGIRSVHSEIRQSRLAGPDASKVIDQ